MAEGRSPWVYIGIGCGIIALLIVVAVVVGGFLLVRGVKQLEAEMNDPVARTERVLGVLGADELPHGYDAAFGLSLPRIMDLAILSSAQPDDDGSIQALGERGLVYVELFAQQNEQELRDYFEGKTSDPSVLRKNKINVDVREILGRGVIPSETRTLMYVTQRGSVNAYGYSGDGITSIILVDCPGDRRSRVAIWYGPDVAPDSSSEEIDLTGTPGDEVEIASFMGHFRVCN